MNKGLMSMHAGLEEEIYLAPPPLPNVIDEMDNNLQQNGEASLVFKPLS
jgi:hypothetical protein